MNRYDVFTHDVGKIAIADNILKKPAKLTDDEYENMKTHTVDILAGGRGTHFDPDLIEIFISVAGDFKKTMVMVQANKQKDIDEQQAS
jgi:response regulator RpfG family c-di-GMP phosphodiesterase